MFPGIVTSENRLFKAIVNEEGSLQAKFKWRHTPVYVALSYRGNRQTTEFHGERVCVLF